MVIVVNDNKERLQKVMASCGVASRRKCEEFIQMGRVFVNGQKVTELGTKITPNKDIVEMDGKIITACGMGAAVKFGGVLVRLMKGEDEEKSMLSAILADRVW